MSRGRRYKNSKNSRRVQESISNSTLKDNSSYTNKTRKSNSLDEVYSRYLNEKGISDVSRHTRAYVNRVYNDDVSKTTEENIDDMGINADEINVHIDDINLDDAKIDDVLKINDDGLNNEININNLNDANKNLDKDDKIDSDDEKQEDKQGKEDGEELKLEEQNKLNVSTPKEGGFKELKSDDLYNDIENDLKDNCKDNLQEINSDEAKIHIEDIPDISEFNLSDFELESKFEEYLMQKMQINIDKIEKEKSIKEILNDDIKEKEKKDNKEIKKKSLKEEKKTFAELLKEEKKKAKIEKRLKRRNTIGYKIAKLIGNIIYYIMFFAVLIILLAVMFQRISDNKQSVAGFRLFNILTQSMKPEYNPR